MNWDDAVNLELFVWLTMINAAAGIVGFLFSRKVLSPRVWKAYAFVYALKVVSLDLLILGVSLICYGYQVLSLGNRQIISIDLRIQAYTEVLVGCILAVVGIALYIVRRIEESRTTSKISR